MWRALRSSDEEEWVYNICGIALHGVMNIRVDMKMRAVESILSFRLTVLFCSYGYSLKATYSMMLPG